MTSLNCTPIVRHQITIGVQFFMVRLNSREKIKAVKRYVEGREGYKTIARDIGVTPSLFYTWIQLYEHHGEKALEKSYTAYSVDFKLKVIQFMNERGTSIGEAAAIFNIPSPTTLSKWIKLLETKGVDGLKPKKKGRPLMKKNKKTKKHTPDKGSTEDLQAEVERLRMENAYLKKLNALVQNKEKSPNKTKRK